MSPGCPVSGVVALLTALPGLDGVERLVLAGQLPAVSMGGGEGGAGPAGAHGGQVGVPPVSVSPGLGWAGLNSRLLLGVAGALQRAAQLRHDLVAVSVLHTEEPGRGSQAGPGRERPVELHQTSDT